MSNVHSFRFDEVADLLLKVETRVSNLGRKQMEVVLTLR